MKQVRSSSSLAVVLLPLVLERLNGTLVKVMCSKRRRRNRWSFPLSWIFRVQRSQALAAAIRSSRYRSCGVHDRLVSHFFPLPPNDVAASNALPKEVYSAPMARWV